MAALISVDEARALISRAIAPLGAEEISLEMAAGRVLARGVVAAIDQPPFDAAAMDGYAVRFEDVAAPGALRVIGGSAKSQRVEYRIAAADINPYVALACAIGSGLWGIENKIEPDAPIVGNAYEQTEPRTLFWRDTIDDFMGSDFIAHAFGTDFRHIYGQQKLKEMRSFNREVTDLEYAWYLRPV